MARHRIGGWRKKRGFTQEQLAQAIGCSLSHLQSMEQGHRHISDRWTERIARVLDVPISQLWEMPSHHGLFTETSFAIILEWDEVLVKPETRDPLSPEVQKRVTIPVPYEKKTILAVRVPDSSMSRAGIPQGNVVVYDYRDLKLKDNAIYLIQYNGEAHLRRYRMAGGPKRFEAESHEPGYDTIFPRDSQDFTVLGRIFFTGRYI